MDISRIVRQYQHWMKHLPRVHPFYAMKCNNQKPIIETLHELGTGFDCASTAEIKSVMELGVDKEFLAKNVIFANPCKQISHIQFANKVGVKMTTADNVDELHKLAKHWPGCHVVLRICVDDSKSVCKFSTKFGSTKENIKEFIETAKNLKLHLAGVSFHVGSGCYDSESFVKALTDARAIFDLAKEYGYDCHVLDIGGGFPGNTDAKPSFSDIADSIRDLMDKLFDENVRIIAEPGRFFAAGCYTLITHLFAKRKVFNSSTIENHKQEYLYYINDGVYQSFNCLFFDHAKISRENIVPIVLNRELNEEEQYISKVFGPTCDSLDMIVSDMHLPKLEIGDWISFPEFGAYTIAASSSFNGFMTDNIHFIWRE
jgi:ornithine decarboxylase